MFSHFEPDPASYLSPIDATPSVSQAAERLSSLGFARLPPAAWRAGWGVDAGVWKGFGAIWNDLPADAYLRDGGRYRRRRHGCAWVDGRSGHDGAVQPVPHRAHWQPEAYNALHGGLERWFEPLPDALVASADWQRFLVGLARLAHQALPDRRPAGGWWATEVHAFRIDTTDGIGRPTPEGAHRDGVDLVAVMLMNRHGVKGGETRVFEADGPQGLRFTLTEPGELLLLDDERVIHETTPIQPLQAGVPGWRDTLVVTLRSAGFQGPATERLPRPPEGLGSSEGSGA